MEINVATVSMHGYRELVYLYRGSFVSGVKNTKSTISLPFPYNGNGRDSKILKYFFVLSRRCQYIKEFSPPQ